MLFQQEVFRKVLFVFGQSIFDTNLFEKRSLFFSFGKNRRFCCVTSFPKFFLFFFTDVQLWQHLWKFQQSFQQKKHQPKLQMITWWVDVWNTIILASLTLLVVVLESKKKSSPVFQKSKAKKKSLDFFSKMLYRKKKVSSFNFIKIQKNSFQMLQYVHCRIFFCGFYLNMSLSKPTTSI